MLEELRVAVGSQAGVVLSPIIAAGDITPGSQLNLYGYFVRNIDSRWWFWWPARCIAIHGIFDFFFIAPVPVSIVCIHS